MAGVRLTPKRRAWLQRLLIAPANRPRGRVGFDCMRLKFTEWDYRTRDGRPIGFEEAKKIYGDSVWEHIKNSNGAERLTELGHRLALTKTEEEANAILAAREG